jgi:hypothetical protein
MSDDRGLLAMLGQTWPARAAKGLLDAAMLPGDVYAGRVPVTGPDGHTSAAVIGGSADLAGLVMSGGTLATVPRGALASNGARHGLPSLPMDEAARIARAKGMGFRPNMPLYHGSHTSFDAFKAVPTNADGWVTPGVSLALDPRIASQFAERGPAFGRAADNAQTSPQVYKLWHRAENPGVIRLSDTPPPHHEIVATLRNAFDSGRDSVMLRNYRAADGTVGDIIIVRDANQLRSPNAAFDPAKRDSANLLAGLAGLGVIGGATPEILRDR